MKSCSHIIKHKKHLQNLLYVADFRFCNWDIQFLSKTHVASMQHENQALNDCKQNFSFHQILQQFC